MTKRKTRNGFIKAEAEAEDETWRGTRKDGLKFANNSHSSHQFKILISISRLFPIFYF